MRMLEQIFGKDFVQILARIFAWILCTDLLGRPKALAGKRQNFNEKIPHNSPCFGNGLGRQEGVETLANLPRPESPRTGEGG